MSMFDKQVKNDKKVLEKETIDRIEKTNTLVRMILNLFENDMPLSEAMMVLGLCSKNLNQRASGLRLGDLPDEKMPTEIVTK